MPAPPLPTAPRPEPATPPPAASSHPPGVWKLPLPRGRRLRLGERVQVMAVVNLTPDSFSDGGRWQSSDHAVEGALEMLEEGADLLDLGAESTRPGGGVYGSGARDVPPDEELGRLLPVLERLRAATDVPISIDTRKAAVARAALSAGADLINDVSSLADPSAAEAVAEAGCPVILMHSRGEIASMQRGIHFAHVVHEVARELGASLERAVTAGVSKQQIILDPGIGFGKSYEQNLALLRSTDELSRLGRPLLVGASRKAFIGHLTGEPAGDRLAGSLAAAGWAAHGGAAILRVHDVAQTVRFLGVWTAIRDAVAAAEDAAEGAE